MSEENVVKSVSKVAKLSVKTVVGDIKKLILSGQLENGKSYPLMRVRGQVSKMLTGTGDYGAWVAFKGIAEGINLITGETKTSSKVFLPEVISDEMAEVLRDADDGAAIQFSFDIIVNVNHDLPTLYQYEVISHVQTGGSDPLALIREREPELPMLTLAKPTNTKALEDKAKELAEREAEEKAALEAKKKETADKPKKK